MSIALAMARCTKITVYEIKEFGIEVRDGVIMIPPSYLATPAVCDDGSAESVLMC